MGVIINNQNTKNLGFALVGRPSIPSSDKKYETIEVEGRDGALTKFIGYQDLKFTLKFNILFQNDIKQKLREIKGLLSQAKTLAFDDSPNFFYKVKRAQISDTETIIKQSGVFSVEFIADPFEFESSSVLEYENVYSNLLIRNNTTYFSQPVLKIFGQGNIKLFVNDELVEVKNINEGITIDSEMQEAYYNDNNMNHQMLGSFPVFEIGENKIRTEGNVNKIEILPNWRWLT